MTAFHILRDLFARPVYLLIFILLIPAFFAVFIFIPVWTIPGNDLRFQLSIYLTRDYLLMAVLALLTALFFVLQIDLFRHHRGFRSKLQLLGKSGTGGAAGVIAAIFGTAVCASCVAAIFGFLGIGTVITFIKYRWYIVSAAIILLVIANYLTLRHRGSRCASCEPRSGHNHV